MKWAADLSRYKAATSPLAKRNTRCVKHLAPASSRQQVLKKELGWLEGVERAKKPARLPVVFTREEARAVLPRLDGVRWMMASLLYGSGLRLMECTRLRVKDVDFDPHQLIVRDGKGGRDVSPCSRNGLSSP